MSVHDVASQPPSAAAVPIRVVVVDGRPLPHDALGGAADHGAGIEVVAEVDDADAADTAVTAHEPDVVLVILAARDADGLALVRAIAAREKAPAIVVLAADAEPGRVRDALRAGARGYLATPVPADDLVASVRRAAAGRWVLADAVVSVLVDAFVEGIALGVPPVTPREQEVLRLLAEGLPNRTVADRLGISTRTAQKHVENLFKKFNVHGRADLVSIAGRTGLMN